MEIVDGLDILFTLNVECKCFFQEIKKIGFYLIISKYSFSLPKELKYFYCLFIGYILDRVTERLQDGNLLLFLCVFFSYSKELYSWVVISQIHDSQDPTNHNLFVTALENPSLPNHSDIK